jgi:hypothetical protein
VRLFKLFLMLSPLLILLLGQNYAGAMDQKLVQNRSASFASAPLYGDTPLIFISGSPTSPDEGWDNAIDGDLDDWDGTVTTRGDTVGMGPAWAVFQGPAWAIFGFDSAKTASFNAVAIQTDNGIDKPYVLRRQASELEVFVSSTGTDSADFISVAQIVRDSGEMQIYPLDSMMTAKYVKLAIYQPNNRSACWRQLVEFQVLVTETVAAAPFSLKPGFGLQPKEMALYQNYPNPFNPVTTLAYEVTEDGMVSLRIYDIAGREMAVLVNEWQNSGLHLSTWDATVFPSGTYFYQLNTGSGTAIKRMSLVK